MASPTDTMLSHSTSKHPLPDDDEDDNGNQHHHHPQPQQQQQQPLQMHGYHQQNLHHRFGGSTQAHHPLNGSNQLGGTYQSNSKLHRLAQKHGLNKKGLVILLLCSASCILLLIALVTLVVLWPKTSEGDHTEVCLTPDCLRASAQ
ncbi:uncharacterized protein LOC108674955, partial [Hyalella azteca]|uniref:Uncharacterized protein LOC108674955 n=1 Tax=Hyalella azteca TaxID=294128 RepID=A0A8B7NXJ1_HYAAZ